MKIVRAPAPEASPWEKLPTDLRLVLAWLGLVKTDLRSGQCVAHPSAPERLRKMAREIEAAYPEVEAVAIDESGPLETSAKRVDLDVVKRASKPTPKPPAMGRVTFATPHPSGHGAIELVGDVVLQGGGRR